MNVTQINTRRKMEVNFLNITHCNSLPTTQSNIQMFRILQLNIHSLRNKHSQLEAEIIVFDCPEVIVISESWLTEEIKEHYQISGYKHYHTTRRDGYGGLSIYIKEEIQHLTIENLSGIENVHISLIKITNPSINVLCIYRAPNANNQQFFNILDHILDSESNMIVCGDLNYNLLSLDPHVQQYIDVINSNSFSFMNQIERNAYTFPIMNGPNSPGSILDHFITDMYDKEYFMLNKPSIADHHCLLLAFNTIEILQQENIRKFRNNHRIKFLMNQYLQNCQTESIIQLHLKIQEIIKQNTSSKILSRRTKLPWINQEILREIKIRDRFYAQYKRNRDFGIPQAMIQNTKQIYTQQRNKVTNLIKLEKRKYIEKLTQEGLKDSRRMWQAMNIIFRKGKSSDDDGMTKITDKTEILETLNNYFVNIGENIQRKLQSDFCNKPKERTTLTEQNVSIFLYKTNQKELKAIIQTLKTNAAAGIDEICAKDLKNVALNLSKALVKPVNYCLKNGIFPATFKECRIKAIYKGSGSKKKCCNYRPISVISNVSKILERLLYLRLYDFLKMNESISEKQFGFLPNSSTTTAALHAITQIQRSMDNPNLRATAAVFIDVAKAFDSISHETLLYKLKKMGIRGKANSLIEEYLFGRKQRVQFVEHFSSFQDVKHGTPQGSALSSLLFLIYVNDCLDLELDGQIQMYADDTLIIYSCQNPQQLHQHMEKDIRKINNWMYNNDMSFNASKTKYILFKTQRQDTYDLPAILINNVEIQQTDQMKYLGLIIDEHLSWKPHISYLKKLLKPYLYVLKQTRYLMHVNTKKSLYFSYIHSHLSYMTALWGYANLTELENLQILQNKAIRNIFWMEYRTMTTNDIMKVNKILNVYQLVQFNSLDLIHKLKHNLIKNNIDLPTFKNIHGYETRGRNDFIIPRTRGNILYNSCLAKGLSSYNLLPSHIKQELNVKKFKQSLRDFLNN